MRKNLWKWLVPAIVLVNACSKDDNVAPVTPVINPASGLFVLDEGAFGTNSAMLTYFDIATSTASDDIYKQQNGTSLGDVGNDAINYGGKMYIVVNNSNKIVVTDAKTAKLISTIALNQPRSIISYKDKVIATSWDGNVAVIDTMALTISKTIKVGSNPEGLAVQGSNIYVVNSGGLNAPAYDNTVSVIDGNSWTETKKITIGPNGQKVAVNSAGNVLVSTFGDYTAKNPPRIYIIDAANNTLKDSIDKPVSYFTVFNDTAYSFYTEYDENYQLKGITYPVIDTKTKAVIRENFITDGTKIVYPYGISIDENNGDVYITDAKDFIASGEVFCFSREGKFKFKFSVTPGVGPKKVLFLR